MSHGTIIDNGVFSDSSVACRAKAAVRAGSVLMHSPGDASPAPLQASAHGSGPMWIATPSSWWTCTSYSLPVLTGAPKLLIFQAGAGEDGDKATAGAVDVIHILPRAQF